MIGGKVKTIIIDHNEALPKGCARKCWRNAGQQRCRNYRRVSRGAGSGGRCAAPTEPPAWGGKNGFRNGFRQEMN